MTIRGERLLVATPIMRSPLLVSASTLYSSLPGGTSTATSPEEVSASTVSGASASCSVTSPEAVVAVIVCERRPPAETSPEWLSSRTLAPRRFEADTSPEAVSRLTLPVTPAAEMSPEPDSTVTAVPDGTRTTMSASQWPKVMFEQPPVTRTFEPDGWICRSGVCSVPLAWPSITA